MRTFNQRQFGRAPPVLPEIRDKYREYKLNTKQVVRWIVCTAAEAFDLKQAKLQAAAEAENDAQGLTEAPPRSAEHDQSAIETQSG